MLKSIRHQYARWLKFYILSVAVDGYQPRSMVFHIYYGARCRIIVALLKIFFYILNLLLIHTYTQIRSLTSLTHNGKMITMIQFMIKIGCTYMLRSIKYNLIISTQASKQANMHAKIKSNKMNRFCSCKSIIMEHTN